MFDIRDRLQEAEQETEASYETLAPAVQELQEIAEDSRQFLNHCGKPLDFWELVPKCMAA